jgi:hypothetical protein
MIDTLAGARADEAKTAADEGQKAAARNRAEVIAAPDVSLAHIVVDFDTGGRRAPR